MKVLVIFSYSWEHKSFFLFHKAPVRHVISLLTICSLSFFFFNCVAFRAWRDFSLTAQCLSEVLTNSYPGCVCRGVPSALVPPLTASQAMPLTKSHARLFSFLIVSAWWVRRPECFWPVLSSAYCHFLAGFVDNRKKCLFLNTFYLHLALALCSRLPRRVFMGT